MKKQWDDISVPVRRPGGGALSSGLNTQSSGEFWNLKKIYIFKNILDRNKCYHWFRGVYHSLLRHLENLKRYIFFSFFFFIKKYFVFPPVTAQKMELSIILGSRNSLRIIKTNFENIPPNGHENVHQVYLQPYVFLPSDFCVLSVKRLSLIHI